MIDMNLDHPLLEKYHYPKKEIEKLIRSYRNGELTKENNIIKDSLSAPSDEVFKVLADTNKQRYKELYHIGLEAIKGGQQAIAVLNGGMATRFGGVVKGVVEVFDGKSFLQLKIGDALKLSDKIDIYIMNSFSTEEKTKEHFRKNKYFGAEEKIFSFNQFIAPRITPEGEFYRGGRSKESFYGPGHGDFPYALKKSGFLDRFISGGGKYLFLSNVDNLGAKIDPAILGMHIESRKELSAEVASKEPGDEGGAPVLVDGRLQLIEGFSFPGDFDQSKIPVFNCNSYWINVESLKKSFKLPWYMVNKNIGEDPVIQFEHICGDLTAFLDTGFIKVSRSERFLPVKRPEDLQRQREKLRDISAI